MVTAIRHGNRFLCTPQRRHTFILSFLTLLIPILLLSTSLFGQTNTITKTIIACGYQVTTVVTYTASGETIFTWTITNTNPGNGQGGTFQDLSHWSQKLDVCVDPDDLQPNGFIYGPDNSQTCLTGDVVKFDRGTSGSTPSTFSLTLDGIYTPVLVNAAFKAGNQTCCAQIWGVGCCELEVTCPTNTSLGTFNCNNLNTIPAAPTTLAALSAAPYNITIGTNPCGTIRFSVASDAPAVNVCAATNQVISRIITIWDDLNGNSQRDANEQYETCTFTYTIEVDKTPPTITCPANLPLGCNATVPAANIASVTATDNCPGTVTVTHVGDVVTTANCVETTIRTYRATDACGNSATCTQTITRTVDNTPPTITCPANQLLVATVPAANIALVTATDNCPGTVTVTHVGDVVTTVNCVETTTRTYRATDACGNSATCTQIFTRVVDNTPPVITCPANLPLGCNATVPAPNINTVTATDACGGPVTIIHVGDQVSTVNCVETTTRTYRATDGSGNSATCTQTITRTVDVTDPTITQAEGADFTADCGVDPAPLFTAPLFADNCGIPTVTATTTQAPGPNNSVIYTRTWTAEDACGNTATASQSITVPPCPIPPTGDEGCTPGYWKNHTEAWCATYSPEQDFLSVFTGITNSTVIAHFTGVTLEEALALNGGGTNALARHAVAALLNACSVDYPYSASSIIAAVVAVLNGGTATLPGIYGQLNVNTLKDALDSANNLGCPLGNVTTAPSTTRSTPATSELSLLASPNPFYSSIRFHFVAPQSGIANLEIYDLMGRKLAKVFQGQVEKGLQKTVDYKVPQELRVPLIYRLTIGEKTSFGKLVPGGLD